MLTVSNPHDHFFRETFSRRDVAVDFFRGRKNVDGATDDFE